MSRAFGSIKALCREDETDPDSHLIVLLQSIIQSNPMAVRERDHEDFLTVFHYAARFRSVEFITVLVEADGGLGCMRKLAMDGKLPFHIACVTCNVEVAKYLHSLYPQYF